MLSEPQSYNLSLSIGSTSVTLPIWEGGSGEPILMLHGWGLDHHSLQGLQNQLASSYRVISIDFPGFGIAPMPQSSIQITDEPIVWGVVEYAECVKQLLEKLNLMSVNILGHSFGGRVGLRLAAYYPDLVKRLVLVASAGLRSHYTPWKRTKVCLIRNLGKYVARILPTALAEPLRATLVRKIASRDYLAAGALRSTLVKVVNEDAGHYTHLIKAPTLLLWGSEDLETPVWMAETLHRQIPKSQLIILPALDHCSILSEGRFQMAYQIQRFMAASSASILYPPLVQL